MNNIRTAFVATLLVLGLSACGIFHRKTVSKQDTVSKADSSANPALKDSSVFARIGPIGPMPDTGFSTTPATASATTSQPNNLLLALLPHALPDSQWHSFSGRADAHFEGAGQSHDFNASIRMERGKSIWVSATAVLNFEVARLLITPDSVWLINRLTRSVFALPFDKMDALLPIKADFESLQSLILGSPMRLQPNVAKDTAALLVLAYSAPGKVQLLQFSKSDTSLQLQYLASETSSMSCSYSNRSLKDGHLFPASRRLRLSDQGAGYLLNLDFNKVSFDAPTTFPFSIPDNYQRK
ncbi:MAG: DUF4292 domain-containing protein [Bacteroidetes bacterium]|nr:DUF4292 domain-containing protein [Bacteroidota bacterium]